MSYVLLRRVPLANAAPATGFSVFVDRYDTDARRPYRDVYQSTTNTGANVPFELAIGALVPGASFCVNATQRQVKYAGDGKVSTRDVANAPACASSLSGLTLTTTHSTTIYSNDATITATWAGGAGPLRVRCALLAAGVVGAADYYAEQLLPAGATTVRFLPVSTATAPPVTLIGDDARYRRTLTPTPPAGLAPGQYRIEVLEETGGILAAEITVFPSHDRQGVNAFYIPSYGPDFFKTFGTAPFAVVARFSNSANGGLVEIYSNPLPDGQCFTRYAVRATTEGDAVFSLSIYDAFTGLVTSAQVQVILPRTSTALSLLDILPTATYALPLGASAAPVLGITAAYGNGQGGVSNVISEFAVPRLALANLIHFNPGRPTDATGGVVVEVASFASRTPGAVSFALLNTTGTQVATNATGRFGAMAAGAYTVRATLAGSTANAVLDVPVLLVARYGLKWRLAFTDLIGQPCRLELWARDYTGAVLTLCGDTDNPVTLETEGFAGGDTQADLPPVIGSSCTMRLRTTPGALAGLLADDRAGRADVYYADALVFSGYVQPDIYEEPMVGDTVAVQLTATDGLAALRDVDFTGHVGQELRGRRPVLHTLLHCLSRTDLALPLGVFTNRRPLEMSTDEQPETDGYTDRLAYSDAGKPLDQRAVLNALCVLLGGTLVQRGGRWEVRSALEAAGAASGRTYDAAGDHAGTQTLPAPTGRLTPAPIARADAGAALPYYWQDAGQHRQRRAGWRYLTASGDATYATNAFRQGDCFSDPTAWDASGTVLLPAAGWRAGERAALDASAFPLTLVEAGGSSDELATKWPAAQTPTDARYLESEMAPLAVGREGLPVEISVSGKFYFGRDLSIADDILKLIAGQLWVEIVGLDASGQRLHTTGAVLRFPVVRSLVDGFTTAKARLLLPVLPGAASVRVRVHPYTYFSPLRARDNEAPTAFLLQSIALQVQPQGATWKAADAYYASGAGGSVRPAGLEVFHLDAPQRAGLFGGVAYAFRRSVTRTAADYPVSTWARADDARPAPLLASAVLDTLALRANPSQVLVGTVAHTRRPPEALDAIDAPYDASGRRLAVGARAWDMRPGTTTVSLVEIGEGEYLILSTLPPRVRLLHGLAGGRVRIRLRHATGIRAIHS